MLYIASALSPTPVCHSVKVPDFVTLETDSLVFAKPDRIEVWDVTSSGLSFQGELRIWGTIVDLARVSIPGARPHVLVLVGPPNAQLLLVTWEAGEPVITATQALAPPTPMLRRQEYFTAVISEGTTAIISLWVGLLACSEMEFEKTKEATKRRASTAATDMDVDGGDGRRLVFKSSVNINIAEHNLLDLAFTPGPNDTAPVVTFLWMSEYSKIQVQPRSLSMSGFKFVELGAPVDVVNPLGEPMPQNDDLDFGTVPFSCPAGRNILPIAGAGPDGTRQFLVIGDEHTVLYSIKSASNTQFKPSTSPRASAVRRSPQAETGGIGKKRKSSTSGRSVATDLEERMHLQPVWRVRQGYGVVLASTLIESHGTGGSVLLGDEVGRLTAVGWEFEGTEAVQVGKTDLGVVSPPTALSYVDNGFLFVSSACGDSQLVSLSIPQDGSATASPSNSGARAIHRKGKGRAQETVDAGTWAIDMTEDGEGEVSVRERWMNLAPVKDFTVVEEEDGRLSHLVVASGSANTNSLRIVRSGVGFENVLSVESIPGIQNMWSLAADESNAPTLLVSFAKSSAILTLEPEISVLAVATEVTASATIAAGLVDAGILVQVTSATVHLWSNVVVGTSLGSYEVEGQDEIVAASVKGKAVAIALRSGNVVTFKALASGLEQVAWMSLPTEVSAIAVIDADSQILLAVSDWCKNINIYTADGLAQNTAAVTTAETAYASSLSFRTTPSREPQLLAGLSDGSFVSYDYSMSGIKSGTLKGRTMLSLGTRPLQLVPITIKCKGDEQVFAAGITERLSIGFDSRGHSEFSSSGKKDVTAVVAVTTPSLGGCIVLATPDGLSFERLTSLNKVQVQTLDMETRSATKVAYVPELKVVAVGVLARSLDAQTGEVLQTAGFEIRHASTLQMLAEYQLQEREVVVSVNAVTLSGKSYVAVGTVTFDNDEAMDEAPLDETFAYMGAEKGRLLLMDASNTADSWSIESAVTMDTNGAVFDARVIHNFLAVACPTKVSIYRLDASPAALVEVSAATYEFAAQYLEVIKAGDDRLVVGDAMRSILVIDVDAQDGRITGDQRDMSSIAVRGLSCLQDGGPGVILTDSNGHLKTFRLKDDDIEPAATFGLHEDVARLRKGSFAPTSSAADVLRPSILLATANGRLGVIGELAESATRTLDDLQRNMNKYKKGPGGLEWKKFRRGGIATMSSETRGFIDGDFVQHFLDEDAATTKQILEGASEVESVFKLSGNKKVPASREEVARILEAAAGMH